MGKYDEPCLKRTNGSVDVTVLSVALLKALCCHRVMKAPRQEFACRSQIQGMGDRVRGKSPVKGMEKKSQ